MGMILLACLFFRMNCLGAQYLLGLGILYGCLYLLLTERSQLDLQLNSTVTRFSWFISDQLFQKLSCQISINR